MSRSQDWPRERSCLTPNGHPEPERTFPRRIRGSRETPKLRLSTTHVLLSVRNPHVLDPICEGNTFREQFQKFSKAGAVSFPVWPMIDRGLKSCFVFTAHTGVGERGARFGGGAVADDDGDDDAEYSSATIDRTVHPSAAFFG